MISNIKPSVRGQGGCSNLEKDNKKELDALKTRVDDLEGKVAENTEKLDAPDISKNTGTFKTINTDVLTSGKTQSGEVIADILKTDRIAKKTVDTLDIEHENINTKTVNAETLNVTNLNAKTANLPGNMSFDNIAAKNIDSDVVDAAVVDVDDLTVLNRMSDLGVDNLDTTNVNVAEKVTAKQAEFKEAITAVTAQIDDIVSKNITSENTKTTFADITNAEIDEARLNTLYAAGHKGNYSVSIPETLSPLDLVIFNVPLVNGYYIVKNEEFSISFFINKSADTDTRPAIFYQLKQKVVGTVPEVRVGVDGNLYFSYARQKEDISLVNFAFVDLDETLDGMLKVTMVDWPEEALYASYPDSYCSCVFMSENEDNLKVNVQGTFSAKFIDFGSADMYFGSIYLNNLLAFHTQGDEYPVVIHNTYNVDEDTSTLSIDGADISVGTKETPQDLKVSGKITSDDIPVTLETENYDNLNVLYAPSTLAFEQEVWIRYGSFGIEHTWTVLNPENYKKDDIVLLRGKVTDNTLLEATVVAKVVSTTASELTAISYNVMFTPLPQRVADNAVMARDDADYELVTKSDGSFFDKSIVAWDGINNCLYSPGTIIVEGSVEKATQLIPEELQDSDDLDNLTDGAEGKQFYANTGNTVANKPEGVDAFSVSVFKLDTYRNYYGQILISQKNFKVYYRSNTDYGFIDWVSVVGSESLSNGDITKVSKYTTDTNNNRLVAMNGTPTKDQLLRWSPKDDAFVPFTSETLNPTAFELPVNTVLTVAGPTLAEAKQSLPTYGTWREYK